MSDLDDAFQTAVKLEPDDRLRLVARLWKTLPGDHRAALVSLQLEEAGGDRRHSPVHRVDVPMAPIWPKFRKVLFDKKDSSGLYSAPRRFDLATIFVVTAAFSILLGGMSAIGAHPIIMVVIGSLLAFVAAAQSLFRHAANPRGISIIAGAVGFTLMLWILWFSVRHVLPNSFFVVTFIIGIFGGAILGYLAGTLVGGVFLVADMVRGKFERRRLLESSKHDPTAPEGSPFDETRGE